MPSDQRAVDGQYSLWPRAFRAGVAAVEAAVCVAVAVAFASAVATGGTVATAVTLSVLALAVAAGMGVLAWALARGRRWPTGAFLTVQLLVAVIAVSQGARSWLTFAANPAVAGTTLAALLLAVAGLAAVALGERPLVTGSARGRPGD